MMIKISLAAACLLVAVTAAHATERDMTCRGLLEGPANYRVIGPDARMCYVTDAALLERVNASCQSGMPCVVRARVTFRDTPTLMPQTYNVVKVYSARTGN